MPLKIVRNDITRMHTEAIVNTANEQPTVDTGCDRAIYKAAGYEELLRYRVEKIGAVPEGEVFLTPGFRLPVKYIIHAVSPRYRGGNQGEEEKLRSCYRKSLQLAAEQGVKSIAFPLIAAGSFGYPREESMRIAVDEIHAFLLRQDMEIFLVVFGEMSTMLGEKICPGLESYIDRNYVRKAWEEEYGEAYGENHGEAYEENREECYRETYPRLAESLRSAAPERRNRLFGRRQTESGGTLPGTERAEGRRTSFGSERTETGKTLPGTERTEGGRTSFGTEPLETGKTLYGYGQVPWDNNVSAAIPNRELSGPASMEKCSPAPDFDFGSLHESRLEERMQHISDTFSEYLMYLIRSKGMENAEVWRRGIVDRKIFSKIKNHADYHPQKLTALCLCVGAKLNLDESKDLLARAGYALSPCDKTDIIFSYFIENGIYDMIELDIQLEEHGLPCIIS